MNVSVIIPSALKRRPGMPGLWLSQALGSVARQTLPAAEILVGIDPGVTPPSWSSNDFAEGCWPARGFRFVEGDRPGHQAACNACARAAAGPLLAFLEDDDSWTEEHLAEAHAALVRHDADFVTCSHLEVTPEGAPLREFHFPTMSGWLVTRAAWLRLGGVSEKWKIHHDNEFLARFAEAGLRRVHLAPAGTDVGHEWLRAVAAACPVVACLPRMTVRRTANAAGVLAGSRAGDRARRSADELAALRVLYGTHGW